MTNVGELAINVLTNFASVTTDFARAADNINRDVKKIESQIEGMGKTVEKVFKAIGVGAAIRWTQQFIADSIEAQASLADLAKSTGATVEALSSVRDVARLSGTSLADVGTGMQKLARSVVDAQSGTGKAADALQRLGINAKTFAAEFRTTDQQILAVAKSFATFADGPQKTAAAMELLGKSGANLLPFLSELAERGIGVAKVTTEQAQRAKELQDAWESLRIKVTDFGLSLATSIVPALQKIVDNFGQLLKITGLAVAGFAAFRGIPAIFAAATVAITAYKEAVIGAVLAEELLGIKPQKGLAGLIGSLSKAQLAMVALQGAAVLAIAAFAGWEIGSFLEKNFLEAKLAGIAFVAGSLKGWEDLKLNFNITVEAIKYAWAQAMENMRVTLGAFVTAAGRGLSSIPGLEEMGQKIEGLGKTLTSVSGDALGTFKRRVGELAAENAKAKASITAITDDQADFAIASHNAAKAVNSAANANKQLGGSTADAKKQLDEFGKALGQFQKMAAEADASLTELLAGEKFTAAQKAFAALKASDVWKTFNAGQKEAIANAAKLAEASQKNLDQQSAFINLSKELNAIGSDFNADYVEKQKVLTRELEAGRISLEEFERLLDRLRSQQPFAKREADAVRDLIRAEQEAIDVMARLQDQATQTLGAYADQNVRLEQEIGLIGLSEDARARVLVLMDAQAARQALINAGDVEGLELLDQQIAKRMELATAQIRITEAVEAQKSVFRDVAEAGADFIEDFVRNGSSAFKRLWENFKGWALRVFAEIAAKQIVVSIAGTFSGGAGNLASQALGGAQGIGSLFGGLGGASGILGSLFGGIGATSALGPIIPTFGTSFLSGLLSPLSTAATLFTEGFAAFGSTMAGLGAAVGAAVPVIGAVLGIVSLVTSLFGSKGGPKSGGFAASNVDLGIGDVLADVDAERFFTPSDADATVREIVDNVTATYRDVARSFGARAGSASFGIGFDTDPEGDAPNRVSASATVGGRTVFSQRDLDVGRDADELQRSIGEAAARSLLAALQETDFEDYLDRVFDSLDVATASAERIDTLISIAQAVKLAVDAISQLGPVFENLDPDSIIALVKAFGGLEEFAAGFSFLAQNFTTDADKIAAATARVNDVYTDLDLDVPQTHAEFMAQVNDLLELNTEESRAMAAVLLTEAAPAFVAVHGTAQDAANAIKEQADANRELVESAEEFFDDNFYSSTEKAAKQTAKWTAEIDSLEQELGITIPRTTKNFRDYVEALREGDTEQSDLYEHVVQLAPAVHGLNDELEQTLNIITQQELEGLGQAWGDTLQANIDTALQGMDFGGALSKKVVLFGAEINRLLAQQTQFMARNQGQRSLPIDKALSALRDANQAATAELAQFTLLAAQYDAKRAQELLELQRSFAESQAALMAGGAGATVLAALEQNFQTQWNAIINGTAGGVDGTIAQLERLRKGIRDYLDGLRTSDLSPLKPGERLAEAQRQFNEAFAKAAGGDLEALADITQFADRYLQTARELFASGTPFRDIFNDVTSDLESLAGAGPDTTATSRTINDALPDGTLASDATLQGLRSDVEEVKDAVAALAEVIEGTSDRAVSAQERMSRRSPVRRSGL